MQSDVHHNYYLATALPSQPYPRLEGEARADVGVVGGGIAGCSAALHLAQRGYRVMLLEADRIGAGASGRSGGQLLPGYSSGQGPLVQQLGLATARLLWDVSVEALNLSKQLIAAHHIECDLQPGHLTVAIKARQQRELRAYQAELEERYQYTQLGLIEGAELRDWVASDRYRAALHDAGAAHVHPLNYTLGLARAATNAGAILYEQSRVLRISGEGKLTAHTAQGAVTADHVVMCCNAYGGALSQTLDQRIMPIATYIIATEVLGPQLMQQLLPHNVAVADTNFILDYFRRSADHRLLFGGRVSYSGRDFSNTAHATRQRMLAVFPQLRTANIDHSWGGLLDITLNRAPDFGRLKNNLYYLQGFSGHGMALAGLAGKLVAETIAGQAERFDLFTRIQHRRFPGGKLLRTPALVLAMLWYRLRDLL